MNYKLPYFLIGLTSLFVFSLLIPSKIAKASSNETSSNLIISTTQVKVSAEVLGYDSKTNKYRYKFSWSFPTDADYLIKINGKTAFSQVRRNDSANTSFSLNPATEYKLQVYFYRKGFGRPLAEGVFKTPSNQAPDSENTIELTSAEKTIISNYSSAVQNLPSKKVKSTIDFKQINALASEIKKAKAFSDLRPYWSSATNDLMNQAPNLLKKLDLVQQSHSTTKVSIAKTTIYEGENNASLQMKVTYKGNKKDTIPIFFIKESGEWKIDFPRTLKARAGKSIWKNSIKI